MVLKKATRNQFPFSQSLNSYSYYLSFHVHFTSLFLINILCSRRTPRIYGTVDLNDHLSTTIFSLILCLQNPIFFSFSLFRGSKLKPSSVVHTDQSRLPHSFATVIGLGLSMRHDFS